MDFIHTHTHIRCQGRNEAMMSSMPLECWLFTFHIHLLVFLSFLFRACLFWEEWRLIFCVIQANCLQSAAFKRVSANALISDFWIHLGIPLVRRPICLSSFCLESNFRKTLFVPGLGVLGKITFAPVQYKLKSSCLNCVEEIPSGIKPSSFWSCCLCCSCIGLYHYITTI